MTSPEKQLIKLTSLASSNFFMPMQTSSLSEVAGQ